MHVNKFRETRNFVHHRRENRVYNEEKKILSRMLSKFIGLLLQLFAIFLFISFVSYLFSFQNDQIIVESHFKNFSFDSIDKIQNLGGLFGAVLSYVFIYKYFGFISALIIVFLIFIIGSKLARFKFVAKFNIGKIISRSISLIFIINGCVGIFHLGNSFNGNFSGFLSDVIAMIMFKYFGVGTYFIIVFFAAIFLFFSFKGRLGKKLTVVENPIEVVDEKKIENTNDDVHDFNKEVES